MRVIHLIVAVVALGVTIPIYTLADDGPESNRRDDSYYTESEARDKVFGKNTGWRDTVVLIDSVARHDLYEETGLAESDSAVRLVYVPSDHEGPAAVYRVASEVGKHNPFEFLVGLDEKRKVKGIVVLNYREARGGDVRRGRFLGQFKGKGLSDAVRVSEDIIGISGATLSSRAITRGVRKTLWWTHKVWPRKEGKSP